MEGAPEGWEWVLIQERACPQCGHHPAAMEPDRLGEAAMASLSGWRQFLTTADDAYLRTHPAPDVWSPIQYGAHVRDMLQIFGDRILLAVRQDDPAVPWFDPGPEGWASYDRMSVADLLTDLAGQTERFDTIIGDRAPEDWSRTARRDGVDRFTVAGLACFAVHEAHHHLLDADGSISA